MKKRNESLLADARRLLDAKKTVGGDSFASELATKSLEAHISELEGLIGMQSLESSYELLEVRLSANTFRAGSIPLGILADISADVKRMFGFAALRFSEGGAAKKRVPEAIYQRLDLRLAGLLPGSSRLIIAAAAHRDLFDSGPAQQTLTRIFDIVQSAGAGERFLEGVSDLGPSSAKNLRDILRVVRAQSASLHLEWSHRGDAIASWTGEKTQIETLTAALERTELKDKREEFVSGTVEMLSKRERLHIRDATGALIRVLFPTKLLGVVSGFRIDQRVEIRCERQEMENPLTGETSITYQMLGPVRV